MMLLPHPVKVKVVIEIEIGDFIGKNRRFLEGESEIFLKRIGDF